MAEDATLNNAMLLQRLLEDEYRSLIAERDSWEACVRAMTDGTSPCGHSERYAHTNDGGKTIICTLCALDILRKQVERVEGMLLGGKGKMLWRLAKRLEEADAAYFNEKKKADTAVEQYKMLQHKLAGLETMFKRNPQEIASMKTRNELLEQKIRRIEAIATKCPNCAPQV